MYACEYADMCIGQYVWVSYFLLFIIHEATETEQNGMYNELVYIVLLHKRC